MENVVLERGKRAGNILLVQTLVNAGLTVMSVLTDGNSSDYGSDLIVAAIASLINIAISFILISPLKHDRLKDIRIIYIILCCISVAGLYSYFKNDSLMMVFISLLGVFINVLVIIAMYNLGATGKICCYVAAGLSLVSAFLSFTDSEFFFPDLVDSVFSFVYFIFLGLYIESKGIKVEPQKIVEETPEKVYVELPNNHRNNYDDLIKLKELMDAGVITPAEYDAKKKQILGL